MDSIVEVFERTSVEVIPENPIMTAEQFLSNLKTTAIRKDSRYDNESLADWNRAQTTCAICGKTSQCENSHTVKKGRAGKSASQVYALPLCHSCHVEYETTSIEDYLIQHPNLFVIVTRNIERWADYFTNDEKLPPRKVAIRSAKKDNTVFKKIKNSAMEKCKLCFFKSLPTDEVRHYEACTKTEIKK